MNVLAGLHRPDAGTIAIERRGVDLRSPRDAIDRGIGMVHQHFRLVDRFTVAENVTLGWHTPQALSAGGSSSGRSPPRRGVRDARRPGRPIWQLSVGEQQRVEILKNLYRGADVLILDEPTAVLTPQEAVQLFESLRGMAAARGGRSSSSRTSSRR